MLCYLLARTLFLTRLARTAWPLRSVHGWEWLRVWKVIYCNGPILGYTGTFFSYFSLLFWVRQRDLCVYGSCPFCGNTLFRLATAYLLCHPASQFWCALTVRAIWCLVWSVSAAGNSWRVSSWMSVLLSSHPLQDLGLCGQGTIPLFLHVGLVGFLPPLFLFSNIGS